MPGSRQESEEVLAYADIVALQKYAGEKVIAANVDPSSVSPDEHRMAAAAQKKALTEASKANLLPPELRPR